MKRIINLTPHAITVRYKVPTATLLPRGMPSNYFPTDSLVDLTIPSSGMDARVIAFTVEDESINGIPVVRTTYGGVEGLPNPEPDTIYVVSALVLTALGGTRDDVVAPDTGHAIRDSEGRIVAVPGFTK